MSNQDIIDQLTTISSKLDQGVQIIATDEKDKKTPIKITASNSEKKDNKGQYLGNLNVNADFSGSVKLNNKTSNILIYGENGTTNRAVSVDTNGKVYVNDTGSQSYLASIDAKLTSTSNKLQVQDTAVNTSLNTIITKLNSIITPTRYGSHNNVYSGNLAVSTSSSALDISLYKNAVISYTDTSYTLNNTLQIIASSDSISGDYDYIGLLIPVTNTTTSKRYASAILELSPFKYLKITNLSGDTINDISCSLYGSG
jgi:hypothetical protein